MAVKKKTVITVDDLAKLGQKRVDETRTVDIPSLGGSVTLRQLSGAEQDAAVAKGSEGGIFDPHIVVLEQIKYSLVDPALPEAEADAILNNLPIPAFGELQAAVQSNSGLNGISIEELMRSFRLAKQSKLEAGSGEVADNGAHGVDASGLAGDDTEGSGDSASVPSVDEVGAATSTEKSVDDVETIKSKKEVVA